MIVAILVVHTSKIFSIEDKPAHEAGNLSCTVNDTSLELQ